MKGSPLYMKSIAASDLIQMLEIWTAKNTKRLYINPYEPPSQIEKADDLQGPDRMLLGFTEQIRRYGIACLTEEQRIRIPRVPLTNTEVRDLLHERMEQDEKDALRQLMYNKSESAWIMCRLQINRPIITAVLAELRENRSAQVNFVSILAATRFKYASNTGLVPAKYPNTCGNEDNYLHLLSCYNLQHLERPGVEGLDFLIKMARRTVPPQAGKVEPLV